MNIPVYKHEFLKDSFDDIVKIANKDDVILIAETLLENETITAEEINYLLEHRTLKKEVEEVKEDTQIEESKKEETENK